MNNMNFNVPYRIGTRLVKVENGQEHLDRIEKYVIDSSGLSAILMLDIDKDPRLSKEIGINNLLENWKKDDRIRLTGDIGTKLNTGMSYTDGPVLKRSKKRN